jgi:DNA-binding HxlR family transcriptional regulator
VTWDEAPASSNASRVQELDFPAGAEGESIAGMAQYGDYCPLSRAAEIFATRWTPLIVRNLQMGCTTFSAIHAGVPGISRTLLSQRLRMLEHHGIVQHPPATKEYVLTDAGVQLGVVCNALGRWGELWIELAPEQFDASKVLWALSVKIDEDSLPADRFVLRFDVAAPEREHY